MKAIIFALLDIIVPVLVKMVDEAQLKAWFGEWARSWIEKHLTVEEIGNELEDVGKLIKKIF